MTSTATRVRAVALRHYLSTAVVCGALVALVIWQRHRLAGLPAVLLHVTWGWVAAAVLAQSASIAALARQQRALLGTVGVRYPLPAMMATTYAANAVSSALPLLGSATSAVFAYRRFLSAGADRVIAAWALIVSGVTSSAAFVAIAAVAAVTVGSVGVAAAGVLTLLIWVVPVTVLMTNLHHRRVQHAARLLLTWALRVITRITRRPRNAATIAASTVEQLAAVRLTRRTAARAGWFALVNWTTDIACLACAVLAVGGSVPTPALVLAWAAGSTVSSLGLTPGGLGVVEAALAASLVAAGLPAAQAAASVLIYRAINLWLVLGVGAVALLVIQRSATRNDGRGRPAEDAA